MYIRDIFKTGKKIKSFEIFPPKQDFDVSKLFLTINELKELNPDFVSVTYGAGGGTRDKTVDIASKIKNQINIEAVAHFTCVNSSKDDIISVLNKLKMNNIQNILALRGDPPSGQKNFTETIGGFKYAYQLVEFIKQLDNYSIIVAGYPTCHPDSSGLDEDIKYLKLKVDMGADLIITQLFFENETFYRFREMAYKRGIKVPIVPGIIPILNFNAIKKMISLSNARIPDTLYKKLEKVKDFPEEIEKIGIDFAITQSLDLFKNGVPGLHLYTMNKSREIKKIFEGIKYVFN